jgi:hypothetical protein
MKMITEQIIKIIPKLIPIIAPVPKIPELDLILSLPDESTNLLEGLNSNGEYWDADFRDWVKVNLRVCDNGRKGVCESVEIGVLEIVGKVVSDTVDE